MTKKSTGGKARTDTVAGEKLRSFIQRVERLNEEIATTQDDRKEVYAEAKSQGFDPGVMRQIVRLRAMEQDKRIDMIATLAMYAEAVGLQLDLFDRAA